MKTYRSLFLSLLFFAGSLSMGCARDPIEEFTNDRAEDPCVQSIPACPPGLSAECILDRGRYARRTFPNDSPFRFFVDAVQGADITISMIFVRKEFVGLETSILWYEPGCVDLQTWESGGVDLFREAEEQGVLAQTRTALSDGEHLIEVFSDMQAEVLIRTDVDDPL